MEGYFNFGFSNSFRKTSSRILSYKNHIDETRSDSDWNCDSIERSSLAEIDTDLDSDSFLSDLEKDSGETKTDCQYREPYQERIEGRNYSSDERSRKYSETQWNSAINRHSNHGMTRKADDSDAALGADVLTRNQQPGSIGANLLASLGPPLCMPDTLQDGVFSNQNLNKNRVPDPQPIRGKTQLESFTQTSCCFLSGLDSSCLAGVGSLTILTISQVVPYWLVTWGDTNSPLVNLGPWGACFERYQFPIHNMNKTYESCYALWGSEFHVIRGWLLPPWFVVVEAALVLGTVLSAISRSVSALIWFKKRQIFPLRLGSRYLLLSACFDVLCGLLVFTSTITFSACCWSTSWLFPGWSYLSWGWAAGLVASWAHLGTAGLQFLEAKKQKKRKVQNENFLKNLEPPLFPLASG